jgi:hypothetical protein
MGFRDSCARKRRLGLEDAMPVRAYDGISVGMPSRGALRVATNAMSGRYVLPETIQNHEVKSECLRLAYLIQAYGVASAAPASRRDRSEKLPQDASSPLGMLSELA